MMKLKKLKTLALYYIIDTMNFKIKEVMTLKGFNNVKLAKELGVTKGTVSNNLKNPTLETLEKISKILNVRVSDLLEEEEEPELMQPIYTKDESGSEIILGYLKK